MSLAVISSENIERIIFHLRGQKIMLDSDLASLYGVETKQLTRAVQRNIERFPKDFMFILSNQDVADLRRHFGTSSSWGGRRTAPYAFTEQGVAMLSSVLKSRKAAQVNIEIMRAFVALRNMAQSNDKIRQELEKLKRGFKDHDEKINTVFLLIDELMKPEPIQKKPYKIGFVPPKD